MAFSYSTGTDASRSTFNDVGGHQIYNVHNTYIGTSAFASGPSQQIHPIPSSTTSTSRLAHIAIDPRERVAAVLDEAARAQRQQLDWQHSIVDLLKVLGLESSYAARKSLAVQWGYEGDVSPKASYAMNIWLHGKVLRRLEESGRGEDLGELAGIMEAASH